MKVGAYPGRAVTRLIHEAVLHRLIGVATYVRTRPVFYATFHDRTGMCAVAVIEFIERDTEHHW